MKLRTQSGACRTISETCSTMVGMRVAKKPTTAPIRTATETRIPAGRGILRFSIQPTTGSRPRAMNSAATIHSSSCVVWEPIQ